MKDKQKIIHPVCCIFSIYHPRRDYRNLAPPGGMFANKTGIISGLGITGT